jgi:hypothetical protein
MQLNIHLNRKERARVKTLRETRLTAGVRNPAACGGFDVNESEKLGCISKFCAQR